MELVYLWVEKYKNIKKQGFNFLPRFECKYEDGKLTICDKKDKKCKDKKECQNFCNESYMDNFFGNNINITAIVGKNGSGKSSILEFILDRLASKDEVVPKKFIFLYLYNEKLYEYNNFDLSTKIEKDCYCEDLIECYENTIALNINSEYKEFESRATSRIFNENNKYEKNSSNITILENYIMNKEQVKKIKEKFFIPNKIIISVKTIGLEQLILYDNRDFYSDEDWKEISLLIESLKNEVFVDYLKILQKIFKLKKEKHYNSKKYGLLSSFENRQNNYQYNFDDDLLQNIPKLFETYKIDNEIIIDTINEEVLSFIKKLPYIFEIDMIDENDINIDNLSFGEKQLLLQLHHILKHSFKKKYQDYTPPSMKMEDGEYTDEVIPESWEDTSIKNVMIFLDEFEIGLHPQWQKKVIDYIVNFLKELTDIKFHIILTSHSPFLLSDIPKQNIIFLDTYKEDDIEVKNEKQKEGNCKVVEGLSQTFGANIHTLLSDSFFMDEGLMGEFAKNKIKKIVKQLNDHKEQKELLTEAEQQDIKKVIQAIGEPFLNQKLWNMYQSLFNDTDAEKKRLNDEMARIQKKLESLQK